MALVVRFIAPLTVFLLAHGTVLAQLPEAPAPHPALDELVKEYKRLGLPIPSPKAELVRVTWRVHKGKWVHLAFYHPSTQRGTSPYTIAGYRGWNRQPDEEVVVPAIPASLEGAPPFDGICFVVECKLRGWDDLASAAYAELRKNDPDRPSDIPPAIQQLRDVAWDYWYLRLAIRGSDRKEVLAQLRDIIKGDPRFLRWWESTLLTDLELTLAPRKSKPGSVEALIDDLTEYWEDPNDWNNKAGQTAYWKLVELGFDAVPALMEHVNDRRLTRVTYRAMKTEHVFIPRVGTYIELTLEHLSGRRYEQEAFPTVGEPKPAKDHMWWAEARKLGEEKWLIENVIPKGADMFREPPNEIILRIIRAKYPQRLKDVYQTVLLEYPKTRSEPIARAIVASKLTREQKVAILAEGAAHEDYWHRRFALDSLAAIDAGAFQQGLIRLLDNLPADLTLEAYREDWKPCVADMVRKTNNPKCWDALTAAGRRVSPELQRHFIHVAGWPMILDGTEPGRRECLRYLLHYVNVRMDKESLSKDAREARDLATLQLTVLFSITDGNGYPLTQETLPDRRELSLLRNRVRELAECELSPNGR